MQSYFLGTLKKDELYTEVKDVKSTGKADFSKYLANKDTIIKERLAVYGDSYVKDARLVSELMRIVEKYNFNARFLIAVNFWFNSNNKPKKITYDMLSDTNRYFNEMWYDYLENTAPPTKDPLSTILLYASVLRKELYNYDGKEVVVAESDDDDEDDEIDND